MSEYIKNRRQSGDEEEGGFFCRFTFGQFFAILILEVCTLFFVFYLGARYGREFLGLSGTQVATNTAISSTQEEGGEPVVTTTDDPDAARLAKELAAKAQTPELKERITQMFEDAQIKTSQEKKMPEVISAGKQDTQEAPQRQTAESEDAATRVQANPNEDSPLEESDRPAKPKTANEDTETTGMVRIKSAENGKYSIQVGSYPHASEANRMLDRWKNKGYPAYVMIADIPERGKWYRVRIGGFGSRDDASRYLKEFQTSENASEAYIVLNEQ